MVRLLLPFTLLISIQIPTSGVAQQTTSPNFLEQTTKLLHEKDQALMDAVTAGDPKVWDAALAQDAIYLDEAGEINSRADLLKQIQPLPPGVSGNIKVSDYKMTLHGDTATVFHADNEEENYHGQQLHARYLTTETWQKTNGDWKLLMAHVYAVLHEPPARKLSPQELDSYVGRYSAGDLVYVIARDGDHLVGGREGKPTSPLNAELHDVLFVSSQLRIRKIFQRDSDGAIAGFVDRREGVDVVWKKVKG
jgi:ketosteroid isomerase-like protein